MTRLFLQTVVSKIGTFTGTGVDVSVVLPTGGSAGASPSQVATLCVHIVSLDAGQTARIQITDSTDSFASDIVGVAVVQVQGGETLAADRTMRFSWYDIPDARFGVTSAKMRADVTRITGGTLTYEVWIEY